MNRTRETFLFCRFLLIAVAACATLSARAAGDNCSTVKDLSTGLGPVHNQSNLEWCYAFTTADLLTQRMQKNGTLRNGERISPLQIAALHHLGQGNSPSSQTQTQGSVGDTLNSVWKLPMETTKLCKESDLSSEGGTDNPAFKRATKDSFKIFENAVAKTADERCRLTDKNRNAIANLARDMDKLNKASWEKQLEEACKTPKPPLDWDADGDDDRYNAFVKDGKWEPKAEVSRRLGAKLDKALASGSMASVIYHPGFMTKSEQKSLHVSSVVAREKGRDGTCYYRIRNSWGPGCSDYKDEKNCKDGYIWVRRDDLLNNMTNVTYLP